jgi:uncharacterized membrane protein YeaQ/YmgE (transglycosylase-associated protein family)
MAAGMQDSEVEDSTVQLIIDQLEELVVTVIEEIRERPGVALAIFAGLIGAIVGTRLATRRSRSLPERVLKRKVGGMGEAAELLGLGMRLLQNPIVRGVVFSAIERQFKRRIRV